MKFYIIHLPRSKAREGNVQTLRKTLGEGAEVIEAVDAQDMASGPHSSIRFGHFPPYPFKLRASEVACFLSHRKCWQKIAQSENTGAVVIEDDVAVSPQAFNEALKLVQKHCGVEDFVRFPVKMQEKPKTLIAQKDETHIFTPKVCGLGMQAQYVGRHAAIRLLQTTEHFDRPVDTTLQQTWVTGQTCITLWPSGITEISNEIGGSLIGQKKSLIEKVYREIARPTYRCALWLTAMIKRT